MRMSMGLEGVHLREARSSGTSHFALAISTFPHILQGSQGMIYESITEADYDSKLREIGNYLWDLEQQADLASARGDQESALALEQKILRQADRAASFARVTGRHQILAEFVAGLGYRMFHDWAKAAAHFEQVVRCSPENAEAWLELTWCYAELKDWARSASCARKSINFFPRASAGWGNLAISLIHLGEFSQAAEALTQATLLEPDDPRNEMIASMLEKQRKIASGRAL